MSGLRGRLVRIEQLLHERAVGIVGLAERMRKAKSRKDADDKAYFDAHGAYPPPPSARTADDYRSLMARTHPESLTHKMADRALNRLELEQSNKGE